MAKILGTPRAGDYRIAASIAVALFQGLRRQIPLNAALIQLTYIANRTNEMSKTGATFGKTWEYQQTWWHPSPAILD